MSRIPRLVELSVSLYRLLLAAYPAAFRNEYSEAMSQLFRDTVLDGYRRRGLFGLMAVWLRTLRDFAVSVARQHREETAHAGESLSLHYLVQQWLTLGGVLLSVIVLSLRYALHVVLRRPSRTCAVASALILLVWAWSLFEDFGIFAIKPGTLLAHLKIYNGVMEFRHFYDAGEPDLFPERFRQKPAHEIPFRAVMRQVEERFRQNPKYRNHLTSAKPWEFSFSSGYWILIGSKPYQYWLLRIPVPVLLVFVLLFYAGTRRLRGISVSDPAVQSA
jgi:hypothetical protein